MDSFFNFRGLVLPISNEGNYIVRIAGIVYMFMERRRNVEDQYLSDDDMDFFSSRIPFLNSGPRTIRFRIFTYRTTSNTIEFYKSHPFALPRNKIRNLQRKMNDFVRESPDFLDYGSVEDDLQSRHFIGIQYYYGNDSEAYYRDPGRISTESFGEHAPQILNSRTRSNISRFLVSGNDIVYPNNNGGTYVKLPKILENRKCILNVKSKDNKCFLWSVMAYLYNVENPTRSSKYKRYLSEMNLQNIKFPTCTNEIDDFCADNKLNVRIYEIKWYETSPGNENTVLTILTESINTKLEYGFINLLLWKNHYVLIKKLSVLFSFVSSKKRAYLCEYCSQRYFYSLDALENHLNICCMFDDKKLFKLPLNDSVSFKNFYKCFPVPFAIYCDFETMLVPISVLNKSTELVASHVPVSFGMAMIFDGKITEKYKSGVNCQVNYIESLLEFALICSKFYNKLTSLEEIPSDQTHKCKLCTSSKPASFTLYSNNKEIPIHIGYAHKHCRRKFYQNVLSIPILFHNLRGYDSHLFIDELAKNLSRFTCIPITKERYVSFACQKFIIDEYGNGNMCRFRFLDSMGFIGGSLASNAERLTKMRFIGNKCSNIDTEIIKNLNKKLPFPYEYITSWDVLQEPKLPSDLSSWKSKLTKKTPSLNDIELANKTFQEFGCTSILDYMMLYLRLDVLLLCEVFEAFREMTLNETGLDCLHYYTTPGLAWDAALKKSGQTLELLKDPNLISFFIERGTIRGGLSSPSELKYHEINDNSSIHYFDVTNLYGYAMTFPLPVGDFKFLEITDGFFEKALDMIKCWSFLCEYGFIFEVDIDYPIELSEDHCSLPFLAETIDNRLSARIRNKVNYRCHVIILKQAIENGLVLKRIHKCIQFKQKAWLKSYVMDNTTKRAMTSDENLRNFYKLLNNAVYGKTMENILNRTSIRVCGSNDSKGIDSIHKKCNVIDTHQLTDNLVVLNCKKQPPVFDKTVYVGFTILEISKYHMYNLLYNVIKKKWKQSKLMYMDTDSLIVMIPKSIIEYEGISDSFDLSGYRDNRKDNKNKGVLGTLKDEYPIDKITRFVCLKSKCYALVTESGKIHMKNKGITNMSNVTFNDYLEMLKHEIDGNDKIIKVNQYTFRSFNHKVFTVKLNKTALKSKDNKRTKCLSDYTTLPLNE